VRQHATKNENETAEIAEIAESYFFSASSASSAVIYKGEDMGVWAK
jgi:hypothetical protein